MSKHKKIIPPAAQSAGINEPREPISAHDPRGFYKLRPSWRFVESKAADVVGIPFVGFTGLVKQATEVLGKLIDFENKSWSEILCQGNKFNHSIAIYKLSKEAQNFLKENQPDLESVYSLRFNGTERLFGKIDASNGTFCILIWDPDHQVCPSSLKHT